MEERRAKITKEKRVMKRGKEKSVQRHIEQIMEQVEEAKKESKARSYQIQEMKEQEIMNNQSIIKK